MTDLTVAVVQVLQQKWAVDKAQWPSNLDYNAGADWWLKRNAKKYGYKYSFTAK